MSDQFEDRAREALTRPNNEGEMDDADSVGTVGSPDCGDMLRMWLKFEEKDGRKVIDRASFQLWLPDCHCGGLHGDGLLKGKTSEEARELKPDDLSGDLGPLPPMKIHCGQLVEQALKNALDGRDGSAAPRTDTLVGNLQPSQSGKVKIVPLED